MALETRRRASHQSGLVSPNIIRFDSLRDDWVKGADLVARLIARSVQSDTILEGFPRQWIPLFVHFGVTWTSVSLSSEYVPIASELNARELKRLSCRSQSRGALRELVEAFASLDPLIADVLYKLDRRLSLPDRPVTGRVRLTGWQSYGRPEVLSLNTLVENAAKVAHSTVVVLPCARRRPYQKSKTHKRIWATLKQRGIQPQAVDKLVVSSVGIVPESLWSHPVVHAYDSGVPDIYRVLRLMRTYFSKARFDRVIDCLEFKPYSDCLHIVAREGLVRAIETIHCGRRKPLPRP